MIFRASIRRPSFIHRAWIKRARPKISGVINGVKFKLRGKDYATDDLTADQVEALRGHPHVIMEISGVTADLPILDVISHTDVDFTDDLSEKDPQTSDSDAEGQGVLAIPPAEEAAPVSEKAPEAPPVRRSPGRPRKLS
jgi:hypothetical protein